MMGSTTFRGPKMSVLDPPLVLGQSYSHKSFGDKTPIHGNIAVAIKIIIKCDGMGGIVQYDNFTPKKLVVCTFDWFIV